ncbi:hypothetical protein PanWU01x14_208440 [Parasponia andersonii]|uniref:Uncharacterized protein n=1 Tax=Parasponia andersonii TaxID=3476 RepID=A0A2P5BUY1_PARAD|nr:hypothetical protein PanWU01x14_208440 [Parasponia andersonii]
MALELAKSTHFSYTRSSSIAQIYAGHKKTILQDSLHQFLWVISVNLQSKLTNLK